MLTKFLPAIFLFSLVFLLGCASQQGTTQQPAETMEKTEKTGTSTWKSGATPENAMPGKSRYVPFTKAEFEKAKAEGKIIFLEFSANWCPFCQKQKPINESVFAEPSFPTNVVGFQVNYKDDQTDADEQALAREFGASYQHTRVIVRPDGSIAHKSTGNVEKDELAELIKEAAGV